MAGWFTQGAAENLSTIDTGSFRIMLLTSLFTYDPDVILVDAGGTTDILDAEIVCTGYAGGHGGAGRKTPTITKQYNNASNREEIALGGPYTWTTLGSGVTISAACLIKPGASSDTTARPIAYLDFTPIATNGSDVTITFNSLAAGGNLRATMV